MTTSKTRIFMNNTQK